MTRAEERLRSAFTDATQTVRPETLRPLTVAAPDRLRTTRWLVPLLAAASVGVLVAGIATVRDHGTRRPDITGPARPSATQIPPPDRSAVTSTRVRAAERSVVKITANAPGCRRRLEGTGFVYAPQRVMTNAHLVAGSRGSVEVSIPAGHLRYQATVVLYDPRRDVAVLAVPGLRAAALSFNRAAARGAPAVIPGYPPHASTLVATAAEIRTRQIANGPDIYQSRSMVQREIFSIRASVQTGVPGAPLLAADGTVYGLVFAIALDHDQTAYALTAQEISYDAQVGRTTSRMVSTQGCAG